MIIEKEKPDSTQVARQYDSLVTVETSRPGDSYTLMKSGKHLDVHLAGPSESTTGGTGPCICGFDRHQPNVGFSVGGGVTGPGYVHHPCQECVARIEPTMTITGLHANLFLKKPENK